MHSSILKADPLNRYIKKQDKMYEIALKEITLGKKQSHWMWYIFPQIRGLAKSRKAFVFGLVDISEATDYLAHPVLGPRLTLCCKAILKHKNKTAEEILGELDAMKLHSCMTIFAMTDKADSVFCKVLQQFFNGKADPLTVELVTGRIVDIAHLKYVSDFIS